MNTRIAGSALAALGLGLALVPAAANAAPPQNLKFEFLEVGSDVVATLTGSLDRGAGSGLSGAGLTFTPGGVFRTPALWALSVGSTSSWAQCQIFTGLTLNSGSGAPTSFGANYLGLANSGSGLVSYLGDIGGQINFGVESSYVDGAAFNSTSTWVGKSFSTLGLNTGTWVYGYGSAGNTVTMQIGPSSGAVPEPGEWAAMGVLGAGLTGLVLRKRRKA